MRELDLDDEPEESDDERTDAQRTTDEGDGEAGTASPERDERGASADDHLDDVNDGCGCAEVWEHLSERRADD